ncbi:hypothetical protein BC938DRAFT_481218 [Jimgerdemannia flammicorona]|uniref:Uncharacterized protein n=1 Tax=Jimgerdemannia flammicorona TaxID=994334 RepID=A0A433QGQ0_9FUNG|nr:hypothetical protein BC938DRAFT_481218 [Jimgerdemannia flammicorona]
MHPSPSLSNGPPHLAFPRAFPVVCPVRCVPGGTVDDMVHRVHDDAVDDMVDFSIFQNAEWVLRLRPMGRGCGEEISQNRVSVMTHLNPDRSLND